MATVPDHIDISVSAVFTLAKPGDILVLGVPGCEKWGQMQVYEMEQRIRNRCPQLRDCVVVPASVAVAVEPEEYQDASQTGDPSGPAGSAAGSVSGSGGGDVNG